MTFIKCIFIVGLVTSVILFSCADTNRNAVDQDNKPTFPKREIIDTILPWNYVVIRENFDSLHYRVGIETPDTLLFLADTCELYAPHQWHFVDCEERYALFTQSHGSDTRTSLVLDLESGKRSEYYMHFTYNLEEELVCYWPRPWKVNEVMVENFVTGKNQKIHFPDSCGSAFVHYCLTIDSLTRSHLYLHWDEGMNNNGKALTYKLDI